MNSKLDGSAGKGRAGGRTRTKCSRGEALLLRRGAVLLIIIVCLFVMSLLSVALVRLATYQRLQLRREHYRQQARWLAESAASRAVSRLRADPQYTGETWLIPATDLRGDSDGQVEITLEPRTGERRTLKAVAHFPAGGLHAVQVTHDWQVTVNKPANLNN